MKLRWEDTVRERAEAVVNCWLEDCEASGEPLKLSPSQRYDLLTQVEIAVNAQRTEYHVDEEDPRKRCLLHPTYKASMPPRGDCQPCWGVWRAIGNPPPP